MPQPKFPPTTATKTFTVTKTKLMVATAALAFAGGLAMMLAPAMDFDDNSLARLYGTEELAAYDTAGTEYAGADYENNYDGDEPAPPPAPGGDEDQNGEPNPCETANAEGPGAPLVFITHDPTELNFQVAPSPNAFSASTTPDLTCWTRYAVREETTRKFVQADGSLKASPDPLEPYGAAVYQTDQEWYGTTVKGLKANTKYMFDVDAKNKNDTHSGWGPETTRYTAVYQPTDPVVANITSSTVAITIGAGDNNPPDTLYTIKLMNKSNNSLWSVPNDGYIRQIAGAKKTRAEWGTVTVRGLEPGTVYEVFTGVTTHEDFGPRYSNDVSFTTKAGPKMPLTKLSAFWDADTPNGAQAPGSAQIIGKFVIANTGNVDAIIKLINVRFAGTTASPLRILKNPSKLSIYKSSIGTVPLATMEYPVDSSIKDSTILEPNFTDVTITSGSSKTFYIMLDTSVAKPGDSLSTMINSGDIVWSDGNTTAIADNLGGSLPLPWQTMAY